MYLLLTDILGLEDYLGDMDFKIAGTRQGITAIQLDVKLPGLPLHVLFQALDASEPALSAILDVMSTAISQPRSDANVPVFYEEEIDSSFDRPPKSLMVALTEEMGVEVRERNGRLQVFGTPEAAAAARDRFYRAVGGLIVDSEYFVTVVNILEYGAVVRVVAETDKTETETESRFSWDREPREGFMHISDMSKRFINSPLEAVEVGRTYRAVCIGQEPLTRRPTFSIARVSTARFAEDLEKKQQAAGPPQAPAS